MVRLNFMIHPKLKKKLRDHAKKNGFSMTHVLRAAVKDFLEKEDGRTRDTGRMD